MTADNTYVFQRLMSGKTLRRCFAARAGSSSEVLHPAWELKCPAVGCCSMHNMQILNLERLCTKGIRRASQMCRCVTASPFLFNDVIIMQCDGICEPNSACPTPVFPPRPPLPPYKLEMERLPRLIEVPPHAARSAATHIVLAAGAAVSLVAGVFAVELL